MSRRWDVFPHVSIATRTSSGTATGGIRTGEYIDGQLVVRLTGLGVGARLTPYWQSSSGGTAWGDLVWSVRELGPRI
jgi:hypothetical protein